LQRKNPTGCGLHSSASARANTAASVSTSVKNSLKIGTDHATKAAGGRNDTPDYRAVMGEFLRKTGFQFINKDDRAAAVRLLSRWDEIDDWRPGLTSGPQGRPPARFRDRGGTSALGPSETRQRPALWPLR
jgi:hypothetical protein